MYLTTKDLIEVTGASPRQIDYWVREEVIDPIGERNPGSGRGRQFDETIVPKVRFLVEISDAFSGHFKKGMFKKLSEHYQDGRLVLSHGIIISWEVD